MLWISRSNVNNKSTRRMWVERSIIIKENFQLLQTDYEFKTVVPAYGKKDMIWVSAIKLCCYSHRSISWTLFNQDVVCLRFNVESRRGLSSHFVCILSKRSRWFCWLWQILLSLRVWRREQEVEREKRCGGCGQESSSVSSELHRRL